MTSEHKPEFIRKFKRGFLGIGWRGNYTNRIGGIIGLTSQVWYWRPTRKGIERALDKVERKSRELHGVPL